MADPRDQLVDPLLSNEPGTMPPPGPLRLTVRPPGFAPPQNDEAWGQSGGQASGWGVENPATGRPSGRLFEPDQTPAPPRSSPSELPRISIGGWEPSMIGGAQAIGRGIGSLVSGAKDWFGQPAAPAPPPRAPTDPTAAARQMWQQGYPSPQQPSLLQRGVTEGLNIPYRAVEASKGQFDPETGATDVEDRRRAQVEAAADVTTNLAGFGMTGASLRGGASAGVFGGRLSKGFDPNKEKLAELMAQNGQTPQQIWKDTGLVKFADGKWAHEIPDIAASYRADAGTIASRIFDQKFPELAGKHGTPGHAVKSKEAYNDALLKLSGKLPLYLEDIINHPELFRAYPELRKLPVSQDAFMHAQGAYTPESISGKDYQPRRIRYREEQEKYVKDMARGATFDTLLHEIQHAIQQIEGMAKGSNTNPITATLPGTAANRYFLEAMEKAPRILSEAEYKALDPKSSPFDYLVYRKSSEKNFREYEANAQENAAFKAYPESAGENVAELPPQRKNMDEAQRRVVFPPSQFRVPMESQNVEYNKLVNPAGTVPQAQMGSILKPVPDGMELPQMSERPKLGSLYSPTSLAVDRQAAGYSKIKGGTPAEGMNWNLNPGTPLEQRPTMAPDKALRVGDEIIPIVGDDTRKLDRGFLTAVGGQKIKPVAQEGGFDFALNQPVDPRTGLRDVWGNAKGAATQIDKLARAAEARGNRPVIMSTTMGKTGGDFSNQFYRPALELLKRNPPSGKLIEELDTFMRTKNTAGPAFNEVQFPGFGSENVWDVLDKAGGNLRSKLMKALDRKSVVDAGGPDIGLIRVANANPALYNTPAGHMGYHIANVAPGQTGAAAHSVYPIATRGSDVRGFGGSVPAELVLRDLDAGLRKMYELTGSKEYLNRMDYYAIRPPNKAAEKLGLKPLSKTQVVDAELIDKISEYVRKNGLKTLPPAIAAIYLANQGGEAKASPIGSIVDPSRYNAQ